MCVCVGGGGGGGVNESVCLHIVRGCAPLKQIFRFAPLIFGYKSIWYGGIVDDNMIQMMAYHKLRVDVEQRVGIFLSALSILSIC